MKPEVLLGANEMDDRLWIDNKNGSLKKVSSGYQGFKAKTASQAIINGIFKRFFSEITSV